MSDTLVNVAGSLIAKKASGAKLNYTLDFAPDMVSGETIVGAGWTCTPTGPTLSGISFSGTQVTVIVSGGTSGIWYSVQCLATGSTGLIYDGAFSLLVEDAAALGTGLNLPFPSVLGILASMRRDRLFMAAQNFFPLANIDNNYLLQKLVSATVSIQRRLRVHLMPAEMLPNTASQAEIDALVLSSGLPVELEPAYDFNPKMFQGDTWGHIDTRQRPIIAVHSIRFVYPTPANVLYDIPVQWIRLDKKYGAINLVPVSNFSMLPVNAFIISALGGGRTIPNFLEIRYSTGLENIARDWPDILDMIQKTAVLSVLEDNYIPSSRSESTSADGLSQSSSIGMAMDQYEGVIQKKFDAISSAMFGIRLTVL